MSDGDRVGKTSRHRLHLRVFQNVQNSLVGHPVNRDPFALIYVAKKRASIAATDHEPVSQRVGGSICGVSKAILAALGTPDDKFAGFEVVVVEIQPYDFGTPQSGSIKDRDQRRVADSGRRSITAAH